ncbi:hypothetical protein C8A01DRAFT_38908 [Parachaetomium inaequale]|uniref:Uncharacterized protein n=1 Tax=Parachaetomium inaequale TaxID=2588326 RepID=A0AAN6SPE6_9PEZI|nr:hypothetical protein C8A01DRAFT_38908 [Parachaetomium inaequale]
MHPNFLNIAMLSWLSVMTANALPTEEAPVKRASPGLYLCENARFQGYCYHYTTPWGVCTTITDHFPSGDRGVSAAGADWGNWCTLYSQENCRGEELQVYYPGYENLANTGWNDKARSYNCAAI